MVYRIFFVYRKVIRYYERNRRRIEKKINLMKATSQSIPINEDQFFIMKNDLLYILKPVGEEFIIENYEL